MNAVQYIFGHRANWQICLKKEYLEHLQTFPSFMDSPHLRTMLSSFKI